MATDKLMNHTQGESIITNLSTIATNLQSVSAISPAKFGMGYAVCDTAAGTAAKTANLANYTLTEGALVTVKFTYANTAANATLNLNNTGAKAILYKGSALANNVISAGDICTFIYSTNAYSIVNIDTLTGAGTGTVTQIGAENGLITDQSGNADIQHDGKIGLNLKSSSPITAVSNPDTTTNKTYPVALDANGYPGVAVPWTDTTYSQGTGINIDGSNVISNTGVTAVTASNATTGTNGTISVTTNGTTAEVPVKGLGTAAYTASTDYAAASHNQAIGTITGISTTGTAVTNVSTTATTAETGYISVSSYDSDTKTLTLKGILAPKASTFVQTTS